MLVPCWPRERTEREVNEKSLQIWQCSYFSEAYFSEIWGVTDVERGELGQPLAQRAEVVIVYSRAQIELAQVGKDRKLANEGRRKRFVAVGCVEGERFEKTAGVGEVARRFLFRLQSGVELLQVGDMRYDDGELISARRYDGKRAQRGEETGRWSAIGTVAGGDW